MPMTPKDTKPSQYLFRRSHRTASRRYFRWSHAKSRSTLYRSTGTSAGLPRRGFPFGPVLFGMRGLIPRLRIFFRSSLDSYPLSSCNALGRFRGRPILSVGTSTASKSGRTCSLSLCLAPVETTDRGSPFPSTKA